MWYYRRQLGALDIPKRSGLLFLSIILDKRGWGEPERVFCPQTQYHGQMTISMELYELKTLCADMAALGVATFQKENAPASDLISQREAYKLFQEVRVKRWVANGMISPVRNGAALNSKRHYSRAELMALNNAERLNTIINR